MAIKPVWGPAPEPVDNDKLNQMVEYSEDLAGVGTLFRAADPQPAGLNYSYLSGRVRKADGTVIEVAAGSVALTGSVTNYIEVDDEGNVSRNTLAFTDFRRPIAIVVTDSGSVTARTDARVNFDFGAGGGADINLAWEGPWETATDYAEGDIVQNGARVSSYHCTSSHTSAALTEPGVGADWEDVWELIAQAGGQGEQGEPGLPGGSLNWRNDWTNATAYSVNDAVIDGTRKSSYRCHTAHTSSGATRPGLGASWASYWAYVAQAGGTGAPGAPGTPGINGMVWKGPWSSLTTYGINDGVSSDGSTYICVLDNTNQEPPNETYWNLVAPKGDPGEQGEPGGSINWSEGWQDGNGYAVNDALPHGDPRSSYRCKADHTAGATNEPGVGVDWEDYWTLFAEAGSGDANTLQGEDSAYHLDRTNHTGTQAISTVTGLQTALDGKASSSHNHDDRYYTESEIDAALAGKANSSHTHSIANVTSLQDELDGLADASVPGGGTEGQVLTQTGSGVAWADPTGGTGGGHEIQSEGTPLAQRAGLNFTGQGVTATDDEANNRTNVHIEIGTGLGAAGTVEAHISSSQSISNNTSTAVQFGATDTDAADYWDVGEPTKIVVPTGYSGRHLLVANVEFAPNATGYRMVSFLLNGIDTYGLVRYAAAPTNDTNVPCVFALDLEEGDEVQVMVQQTSGGSLDVQAYTGIHVTRLASVDEINALQIQGRDVAATPPADGQVLAWNNTATEWQPVDQSGGGSGASFTENQFKTLQFNAAPAAMEFGVSIGAGTEPVILAGGMDAAAIKAAIQASADTAGFNVDVYGFTVESGGYHSGLFIVAMRGTEPFPPWGTVQNSAVQQFAVLASAPWDGTGSAPAYTLNGGASFNLGVVQSGLQSNQRTLGGDYSNVVVVGSGSTYRIGEDETSPADGFGDATDDNNATAWAWGNALDNYADFDLGEATTLVGITLTISPYTSSYEGPDELRIYGSNSAFSGGGDGGGTLVKSFSGLSPWDVPYEKKGPLLFDAPVTYRYYRYFASYIASGVTFNTHEIEFLGIDSASANFRTYFPFSISAPPAPSATGADAVTSTLYEHGTTSTLVTATSSTLAEVAISGLELPQSTAPTGAYTPANPGHWAGAPPTTMTEAMNRLSAQMYNYFWEPIP